MTDDTAPTPDKPLWKRWWFWVAAVLVLAVIGSMLPEDETPVAADTTTTTTVETTTTEATTTTTVAETTTTVEARDWLGEFHDSFGCGNYDGWLDCFTDGADNDEDEALGFDLAMRVMSVTSIESPTPNAFEVRGQFDSEGALWACTYVRNLFMASVQDMPIVHVFMGDGSQLARTGLIDDRSCRET